MANAVCITGIEKFQKSIRRKCYAEFFERMNEDYAKKHFPSGSVFESAAQTVKRRSISGIFFVGVFFLGAVAGLDRALSNVTNKEVIRYGRIFWRSVERGLCI